MQPNGAIVVGMADVELLVCLRRLGIDLLVSDKRADLPTKVLQVLLRDVRAGIEYRGFPARLRVHTLVLAVSISDPRQKPPGIRGSLPQTSCTPINGFCIL